MLRASELQPGLSTSDCRVQTLFESTATAPDGRGTAPLRILLGAVALVLLMHVQTWANLHFLAAPLECAVQKFRFL